MAGISLKVIILVLSVCSLVAGGKPCSRKWVMIAPGYEHTVGLTSEGKIFVWGRGLHDPLGLGKHVDTQLTPKAVLPDETFSFIASTYYSSFAITIDGRLFAWGAGEVGELGTASKYDRISPVQVGKDSDWSMVAPGYTHALALKRHGKLYAWGLGNYGQLGNGNKDKVQTPEPLMPEFNFKSISVRIHQSFAIRDDGALFAWGWNFDGVLGVGSGSQNTPGQVSDSIKFSMVSAGDDHTLALDTDGNMYSWGTNTYKQLGFRTKQNFSTRVIPTPTLIGSKFTHISAGNAISMAINVDGSLWSFGKNDLGQLGRVYTSDEELPYKLSIDQTVKSVFAGNTNTFAITSDGCLLAWGNNEYGQLGDGSKRKFQLGAKRCGEGGLIAELVGAFRMLLAH